jgi:hypothetical protein
MRIVARISEASCGTPLARRVRRNEIKESKTFFFEKRTKKRLNGLRRLARHLHLKGDQIIIFRKHAWIALI